MNAKLSLPGKSEIRTAARLMRRPTARSGGNGVGLVLLKRLDEALADGDIIHAVIKGPAVNNDGSLKIGYTAPGIDGQSEVIVVP